jgi:hypothetical protein
VINTPSIILWIDPGLTTGWATWNPYTRCFFSGQVFGMIEAAAHISDLLTPDQNTLPWAVGWEDFVIRPGSSYLDLDTTALQVIGATRWIAANLMITTLYPQQAADRVLGEKHLVTLGWNRPSREDDANSAAAHLLSYLLGNRLLPAELLTKITDKMME